MTSTTEPTCLMTTTLPREIHLITLSFLPHVTRYELSLTCKFFHGLIGPVKLDKNETIKVRMRYRPAHHKVCTDCALILPFYSFPRISSRRRIPLVTWTTRCIRCRESKLRKDPSNSCRHMWYAWFFGEWIAVCPECKRFVRFIPLMFTRPPYRLYLTHAECPFPPRTPLERWEFASLHEEARDPLPLVSDKIALLEREKERFSPSLLGLDPTKPLSEYEGLLP